MTIEKQSHDISLKDELSLKTEILLEYDKITANAASYCASEEASQIIKNSHPVYDNSCLEIKKTVMEIFTILKTRIDEPRSWLPSIGFLLPKIETAGIVLDIDEFLAIGLFIERAEELRQWIVKGITEQRTLKNNRNEKPNNEEPRPKGTGYLRSPVELHSGFNTLYKRPEGRGIKPLSSNNIQTAEQIYPVFLSSLAGSISVPDCKPAAGKIFNIIDREGNMRDLPALRAIKKRISVLEKELKTAVSRYSSDEDYKRMLQSPLPSQRDGRTVLAVKSNFRGRIPGIVHEVSSTGQTVFIEPLDAVEKNNELLIEKRNFDAEVQKILRELTECISIFSEDIKKLHLTIIELECFRARAKYSAAIKGNFANDFVQPPKAENLILNQARHPMLKKAVPINISMNNNIRTLIITVPNTGGKTVALKTLGLLAMMNQSGFALPAEEGSALPVFDGIYADIGDEQSINQSLSTFSAHITKISAITACACEKSLILLDELGSGTDPQEGGAIAMAVLDYLIEKKSRMIITTHHGILKNYGYTRQGVENASVEFDTKTLSPTYKIINGIPGESRALDIAEANGLAHNIVENARKYISEDKSDVSEMIKNLEQKQRDLNRLEKNSLIEQNKLLEDKRKADLKELQLRQKETELKRETVRTLNSFLSESRKTMENLVRELKEGEVDREKTLKVKEFLNELAHNVENENAALTEEEQMLRELFSEKEKNSHEYTFFPGMEVIAGSSKQRGTIIRADKKQTRNRDASSWLVKIGSLKISFPQSELTPAAPEKIPVRAQTSWAAEYASSGSAVFELRLLGMRLEEAIEALRRQIEAASLSGLKNFSVIHGTGSGILQKGIHEYLKNDRAISDYYFARPELGGFGRTEVILK